MNLELSALGTQSCLEEGQTAQNPGGVHASHSICLPVPASPEVVYYSRRRPGQTILGIAFACLEGYFRNR